MPRLDYEKHLSEKAKEYGYHVFGPIFGANSDAVTFILSKDRVEPISILGLEIQNGSEKDIRNLLDDRFASAILKLRA